jgi:phosphoglycolate phosphatase-like HAD superfamily hydrolase
LTLYQAVIFDFDGVIVESEEIKTRAFVELYREHGPEVVAAIVEHHRANGGISRRKKIRWCHRTQLGIEPDELALDLLCHRFSGLVEDEVVACDWVAGAEQALRDLHKRFPLFVVSGTPHDELCRIFARRQLSAWFVEVWGSPREKSEIIEDILSRHHYERRRVLFVGDGAADLRAAQATGLRFLGRLADGRPSPFPVGTPAISDLTQLLV